MWELIGRLSNTILTIRISGEFGVGKEAIARLLYRHYPHENAIFFKVNCQRLKIASAPSPMAELNQLLTAPQRHVIYLENIDVAPKESQKRLLELLNTINSACPPWVIVSSLTPLEQHITNGQFSDALFRALDTIHIDLPPLRSRPDKIPQIISWILNHHHSGRDTIPTMDEMEQLIDYRWPRNWRQLQQVVQQAFRGKDWDTALNGLESSDAADEEISEVAAIYILSLARLHIHKDKVMEGLMAASNLNDIGLLDVAIFNEAVTQIVDHIRMQNEDKDAY